MGHRSKRHRAATALRLEAERREERAIKDYPVRLRTWASDMEKVYVLADARAKRVNAARGTYAKPYDSSWQPAKSKRKPKWKSPLRYARAGYRYVNGDYVKLTPRATGITQIFSTNRQKARADAKALAVKQRARYKAKQAGRERYERVKPINAEKLKALKANKQVERTRHVLA